VASGSRARVGRVAWGVVGLVARVVGAGALFWLVFPLWLGIFWRVQGYPLALSDYPRWYALGAFNAAPIVASVGVSLLIIPVLRMGFKNYRPPPSGSPCPQGEPLGLGSPRGAGGTLRRGANAVLPILSALLYALFVPPVAYALLLVYAEMWQYRAWDAMTPTIMRAYGLVGGAAFLVGWAVGWSLCPSRRRAPAGAVARRD
jgi:hypothetical protein